MALRTKEAQKRNADSEMEDSPAGQRQRLAEQLRQALEAQLQVAVASADYKGAATFQQQISRLPLPPDAATPKQQIKKRLLEAAVVGEVEIPSQKRQRLEKQLEAEVSIQPRRC